MYGFAEASRYLIPIFWLTWLVIWIGASVGVKQTRSRERIGGALLNRVPVLVGAAMLAAPQWLPAVLRLPLLTGPLPPTIGTILVFGGLALAVWARWHLGRNWSGTVVVKQGHTLIRTGPYRRVRHPIYSGILLALLGTALAIGEARGFIATALVLCGFIVKLSSEEARMREVFADYADYSRDTARLIPAIY
ncbi:MAG TPA: isoprenylcysteine carboxylmethyltransferase family protein [Stellaceae bacterium]|nr:isoprenylcysteine carboxylmethyltransferase family protein [Stellaceae bacterium]